MKPIVEFHEPDSQVNDPRKVFDCIKAINVDYTQEHFLLLTLDVRCCLIASHVLFVGGRSTVALDPVTVFRRAILDNASVVVLAHNHPSGCLQPSDEDRAVHAQLTKCGKLLQIEVVDTIVFNQHEYHSFQN